MVVEGGDGGEVVAPPPCDAGNVDVNCLFIAAGCNKIVNNVSWGPCGLVSFGAQNAVALFHPESAQILTTLPGHKAVVNCTKWLPSNKDPDDVKNAEKHFLLSGSADGVILVWEMVPRERKWGRAYPMPELHKRGVSCIASIFLSLDTTLIASSSSDGAVLVWKMILPPDKAEDCKLTCVDHISTGSKPMVALSFSKLPGNVENVVLAMGGLDHKIHLYCGDSKGKFLRACILKGHTDWIRSLDFSLPVLHLHGGESSVFLASSSQDKTIRIWKISPSEMRKEKRKGEETLRSFIEGPEFVMGSFCYQISLESLLIGHEDWVYSVEWHPPLTERVQPLSILSASMDKTMMIWRPEKTTGIWVNAVTVGELSHCALGFYGAQWAPKGDSILAHGYGGAFHLWKNSGRDHENWVPQKVPSGHFGSVTDISWARSGDYLLSVSHDQTARVFAPWTDVAGRVTWHEIARPQVHGHDINCLAVIEGRGKGNHHYVSGADEKVARVFEAPLSFLKTLKHTNSSSADNGEEILSDVMVLGANMSALGLSQKPIYAHAPRSNTGDGSLGASDSLEYIPDAMPAVLTEPPVEDQLAWHTLWPESHKLYGHGNELVSLTSDHAGRLVASSCKAQSARVAEIWLWEVGTWRAVGRLASHNLTVTQMEFSPDDSLLLAVSRDRHFSVFSIGRSDGEVRCQLIARQEAHKRIIWACSWNPNGGQFATGSRDKTVKLWSLSGASVSLALTLPPFSSSVTALSWASCAGGVLAVGMESGLIELWRLSASSAAASPVMRIDPLICHVSAVNRLRWREARESGHGVQLATCGADNCVRVLEVALR